MLAFLIKREEGGKYVFLLTIQRFAVGIGNRKKTALMKMLQLSLAWICLLGTGTAAEETRFFEMRTYYAAPGKLEDLLSRFRNHTTRIFEKHGMVNIGYWLPLTNTENRIIYLLAYPSWEAREKSWKEFSADPQWQQVARESERNGKLVSQRALGLRVESLTTFGEDQAGELYAASRSGTIFKLT